MKPWQIKVLNVAQEIARASDNHTPVLVLRGIFGLGRAPPVRGPAYSDFAVINEDGVVVAEYIDAHQALYEIDVFDSVEQMRGNLNRLADAASLTDDERVELFEEARKWIKRDFRPEVQAEVVKPPAA